MAWMRLPKWGRECWVLPGCRAVGPDRSAGGHRQVHAPREDQTGRRCRRPRSFCPDLGGLHGSEGTTREGFWKRPTGWLIQAVDSGVGECIELHEEWTHGTKGSRTSRSRIRTSAGSPQDPPSRFIQHFLLSTKADTLRSHTSLAGWLYRSATFVARDFLKSAHRRLQRESELQIDESTPSPWEEIAPYLDASLEHLPESDLDDVITPVNADAFARAAADLRDAAHRVDAGAFPTAEALADHLRTLPGPPTVSP